MIIACIRNFLLMFLVASSYSRSPSYSADPRRRGSVASLSSRGSYSRYSTDRYTSQTVPLSNDFSLVAYKNRYIVTLWVVKMFALLCLLLRVRDRKRTPSSRGKDGKHAHKVSGKRRRRKSYSPMKKRRRDSPSHLEARRITR